MARAVPFSYRDFAAKSEEPPMARETPAVFAASDVEAAFASGVAKGADEAKAECAARIDAEAKAFAAALSDLAAAFRERRAEDAQRLRADAEAAISILLRRAHRVCAAESALALVDRLLAASADRAKATLEVGDKDVAAALQAEIAARQASDVFDVVIDDRLARGDCRLLWRGGAAELRFAAARAELRRILNHEIAAPSEGDRPR